MPTKMENAMNGKFFEKTHCENRFVNTNKFMREIFYIHKVD